MPVAGKVAEVMNRYGKLVVENCDLAWQRFTEINPQALDNRLMRRAFDYAFFAGVEFQLGVEPSNELLEPVES